MPLTPEDPYAHLPFMNSFAFIGLAVASVRAKHEVTALYIIKTGKPPALPG
jgi:hypothetical protein